LLNSPDGIALSTAEDIHFSADSQINQIAGDSINFSTQKNWIAQAQNKLSLFAAQGGIKAVAAQSKVEIQAQSDALDILAKKASLFPRLRTVSKLAVLKRLSSQGLHHKSP
jgi:type VI secretion system secreted protein VgrG